MESDSVRIYDESDRHDVISLPERKPSMSNLTTIRRVTVVADAKLEQQLLAKFTELGAKGHTCFECRGRGEHEVSEDPWTGATRVRIETIVRPLVAEAIMDYLHTDELMNQPITACIESVQVSVLDRF